MSAAHGTAGVSRVWRLWLQCGRHLRRYAFPDEPGASVRNTSRRTTNWHQNMAFVWSIVRFPGYLPDRKLLFYLSDIRLCGGGNWRAAQGPPDMASPSPAEAIYAQDDVDPYTWLTAGVQSCSNRLDYFRMLYDPPDYGRAI